MGPRTDRYLRLLLVALAMLGWSLAIYLGVRVAPVASSPDGNIAALVGDELHDRVAIAATGQAANDLERYLSGPALDAYRVERAANPPLIAGLTLADPKVVVLWRAGEGALTESSGTLVVSTTRTAFVEHELLVFAGDRWTISGIWRINPDPGTPLVSVDSSSDLLPASAAPSK